MKTTTAGINSLVIFALATVAGLAQEAPDPNVHADPFVPVGKLEVNPIFVKTGVKPNLDWGIEYPSTFNDLAVVGPSGTVLTTEEVTVEVRVDGGCFNCGTETETERQMALWVRIGGEGSYWRLLFYGDKHDVNPSKVLLKEKVIKGTKIDVAARGKSPSGSWYPIVWTIDDSQQLVHLANDETIPDFIIPKFLSEELKSYTTALLSDDNLTVEIGPKDMVFFFELSATEVDEPCFDLQDLVVLVQCQTKNNNGHGNNEDGVDVSNPGGGGGGPNGIEDPSGEIDDEMKTVKVK